MARRVLVSLMLLGTLLLSGCIGTSQDASDGALAELDSDGIASMRTEGITGAGRTEGLLCTPVTGCEVTSGSSDIDIPHKYPVWHIEGEVFWDPVDPTLPTLEVFLLTIDDETGHWSWEQSEDTYWVGTSPLSIMSHVGDDDEPVQYHLHARTRHVAPDPLSDIRYNVGSQGYTASLEVTMVESSPRDMDDVQHHDDHDGALCQAAKTLSELLTRCCLKHTLNSPHSPP